jgi:hypothetical protein
MDTLKWKSIMVPREIYEAIVEIAHAEGRTISGQLRVIFQQSHARKSVPSVLRFYDDE